MEAETDPLNVGEEGSFRGSHARRIAWQSWSRSQPSPSSVVPTAQRLRPGVTRTSSG